MNRLDAVLANIDAANAQDPKRETENGREVAAALLYGQRMSQVLGELEEAPSEALQIAVRAQHIERWKRPRADYPDGRIGYLQWRRDAATFHAQRTAELMTLEGYDDTACARVSTLIRKVAIKSDPDAQTLEDVAALVFMRWYVLPFAAGRSDDELFPIVQKTAKKMSARGREAALRLSLPAALVPAIVEAG
jgi:hypothetical protein